MAEEKECRKYIIRKADGTPIDDNAKYFVLRYDSDAEHGDVNRNALRHWTRNIVHHNGMEELATDLISDLDEESMKRWEDMTS
jgi:hypothetical protein